MLTNICKLPPKYTGLFIILEVICLNYQRILKEKTVKSSYIETEIETVAKALTRLKEIGDQGDYYDTINGNLIESLRFVTLQYRKILNDDLHLNGLPMRTDTSLIKEIKEMDQMVTEIDELLKTKVDCNRLKGVLERHQIGIDRRSEMYNEMGTDRDDAKFIKSILKGME